MVIARSWVPWLSFGMCLVVPCGVTAVAGGLLGRGRQLNDTGLRGRSFRDLQGSLKQLRSKSGDKQWM